jgi:cytochrome b561
MAMQTMDAARAAPFDGARTKFDPMSMTLHWVSVVLVVAQFATAWAVDHVEPSVVRTVLTAHRSTGVALWALIVFRLLWRIAGMRKPPMPQTMARVHKLGAKLAEYGLYALLLVQPVTGFLDSIYRGRAFNLFFWELPAIVHRDRPHASLAHLAHETGAYLLAGLVGFHALAALLHHFVLKDGVLLSMLPGRCPARGGVQPRR